MQPEFLSSSVSVGQLALALGVAIAAGGVAWGSLAQRVIALEKSFEKLAGLPERLARIEANTENTASDVSEVKDDVKDIKDQLAAETRSFKPAPKRRTP